MANTLFLRLESPLQSWGERGQWSVRDTAPEPTKSGIVGLLACALGWCEDARIATLTRDIRVGVRCDIRGTSAPLEDYHTVGGGYRTPQLLNATGDFKLSSGRPHTEQTWRYYLCDASFLAAVQAPDARIEELTNAVQDPYWPVYLGRKSCVPTRPIFDGLGDYSSLREALQAHPARMLLEQRIHRNASNKITCRAVIECEALEEGAMRRRDQLVSRTYRHFEPRHSREIWLEGVSVEWLQADAPAVEGA